MPLDWVGDATFSTNKKYRYLLIRAFYKWTVDSICTFIMLNPSTATGDVSDNTVRRCEGYARFWGFKALAVLNIFALRSTDPKALYNHEDPVGPLNDDYIENYAHRSGLIVCAWGAHGKHMGRGARVLEKLRLYKPTYLKLTKTGIPMHPLYLKKDLKPQLIFS